MTQRRHEWLSIAAESKIKVGKAVLNLPPRLLKIRYALVVHLDQKQCLVDWYAEYKTGILAEFLAFRDMETEAANAIRLHSGKAAEALLNNLAPKHLYRHDQWRFAKPSEALTAAGIDLGEYDALLSSCRTSILKMKFALIETDGGQYAKAAKDQSNYQENARACEKRFQLPVKGQ